MNLEKEVHLLFNYHISMTSKTRILLAEDDPNLGTLLKEYLEAKELETVANECPGVCLAPKEVPGAGSAPMQTTRARSELKCGDPSR